jgi:putative ABC transport system permease protein
VDGVEAAEGEVQFYAQIIDKDDDTIGNPGQGAPTFGANWSDVVELNQWRLEPGSNPPATADEVVIDKGSADDAGYEVGDRLGVLSQSAPKEYELVGIAKFGEANRPAGATFALFTTAEAQRIVGAENEFDAIEVVSEDGLSQETLRARIRAELDDPDIQVLTGAEITEEDQTEIRDAVAFIRVPLFVFAGVALLVGSFIIFNTFSIVVAQRTREMALLRAIGAGRFQVTISVVAEAFVVGVLASAIGLAAGIGIASLLKAALSGFGFDIPAGASVVRPSTVVIALLVGTVITVLSALVPAWKAARTPPIAAIRDVALDRPARPVRRGVIGAGILLLGVAGILAGLFGDLDNNVYYVAGGTLLLFTGATVLGPVFAGPSVRIIGWPLPRLRGMTGTLARENAMRNPRRTSATAAALMIGVAIVGFFTVFASSAKATVGAQVDRAFTADFVLTTGFGFGAFGGFSPDLGEQIAALPEVEASTPLRFGEMEIVDGGGDFLVAFDPETVLDLFKLDPREGEFADLDADGVAVSQRFADKKDWELGTKVKLRFPNGERTLTIRTIYGTGEREGLSDFGLSLDGYALGYPEQIDNQVYVRLADGVSPAEGRKALEKVAKPYPNAEIQDQTEFKEEFSGQINQILGLVYVLLGLAVFIALIGIANTLALSVYERTRELGLLRAVGMSRRQMRSSVRWEAVIIAVLGTLVGLAIGVFFGWAVIKALRDQGFEKFAASVGQLIIIVIAAGIAGVVAALFPARRAAKLDVLRAISTE